MANEDKKDFNSMLHDNKDMPKFQIITDIKSIEKYGGSKMYFAPPIDYDKVMRKIPHGKVITVERIRKYFAEQSGADFTGLLQREFLFLLRLGQVISVWKTKRLIGEH